jgi:hypothetical protein
MRDRTGRRSDKSDNAGANGTATAPRRRIPHQRKNPVRNILHKNADAIAAANSAGLQIGGDAIHQANDIRVGEILGLISLVEYEGASVWFTLRPVLNAIEDPPPET